MRLRDINTRNAFDVWAEPCGDNSPETVRELLNMDRAAFLTYSREGIYSLNYGGNFVNIKLSDDSDITAKTLNHYLSRGDSCLAEAVISDANNRLQFRIVCFAGIIAEFEDVEVGITDKVADTAARSGITREKFVTENLCREISEMCSLKAGSDDYFIVKTGGNFREDFPDEEIDKSAKTFQICGNSMLMSVERMALSKGEIFSATCTVFRNAELRGNVTLAHGTIAFKPRDAVSEISILAAQAMEQLTSFPDRYLATWELYADTERKIELERVAKVGRIAITNAELHSGFTRFFAAEDIDTDNLRKGDALSFEEDTADEEKVSKAPFYDVLDVHSKYVDLKTYRHDGKALVLSIRGYEIMQGRRSDAIALIKAGMSANPLLGLILEQGGELPKCQALSHLRPLTPNLVGIFRFPPTDRQREAIDVALNTPDIALIQGPPGTGKTTVITAIIERLNQEFDKRGITRGQVLVSAFQHDAVANIVSRLRVNSLPAYKFGRRKNDEGESISDSEGEIERWCSDLAKSIKAKNPQITRIRDAEELEELIETYCAAPSESSALSLMLKAAEIPSVKADRDLSARIDAIISELKTPVQTGDSQGIMRKIFALRTSEAGFLDDGADRALELYEILDGINYDDAHAMAILRKAAKWRKDYPPDFLPELQTLRRTLTAEFRPQTRYIEAKTRSDILEAASEAAELVQSQADNFSERDKILREFLLDIENNPDGIIEAVKDYQFVYSATVQQSIGKEIDEQLERNIKLSNGNPRNFYNTVSVNDSSIRFPIYDTVIVDEAARALPMDLLIPMVQGEKRIILVGDHRQLPHIIDEDIARSMDTGQDDRADEIVDEYLKMSMFKYLFERLKELEAKDGIKRTVTLDSQYRMHPLLGEFVSSNFYDIHGEGFGSPLGAEHFSNSLPDLEGKPLAWLDVPVSAGPEAQTVSKSRVRRAEAEAIAVYLAKWLEAAKDTDYTFGVISFYSAQKNLIEDALERKGISLTDNKSRLQVGTVDAFQGKEFDIVILSAVRTGAHPSSPAKAFGHLMSENRLCVSMSRQKRALVVAGASELFRSKFAAKNVRALFNFYNLCKQEGVFLNA